MERRWPVRRHATDRSARTLASIVRAGRYVIADNDQIIPPVLQQIFADGMKATTVHVDSSHVPMISQPQIVTDAILAAVDAIE